MIKYHTGFQSLHLQAPKTKTRNIQMIIAWHRQSLQHTEQIQIISTNFFENIVQYWLSELTAPFTRAQASSDFESITKSVEYCLANIKALNWEKLEFDN